MHHWVGMTVHASQLLSTPPVLHPWLPHWELWPIVDAPWYQWVSCTCQLTLPPTILSLQAIASARPLPLMDPSMGPRWCEMAMWGGDI